MAANPGGPPDRLEPCAFASILLLSLTLIGLQLALMRALSVLRYSHFSYLVISTALLGFGASGTFLTLARRRLEERFPFWSLFLLALFTLSIPACTLAALSLPLDIQYLLYSGRQVLLAGLANLLLLIPFFLGAAVIGLALVHWRARGPLLYGANLLGSGLGGLAALGLMFLVPAAWLPLRLTPAAAAALLLWVLSHREYGSRRMRPIAAAALLVCLAAAGAAAWIRPPIRPDPYKALSQLERLEAQGEARRLLSLHGPRGQIDVYASGTLHQSLFAGLGAEALPPEQLAVLVDGELAGTIFRIDHPGQARILDSTPQSAAYRLIPSPRVLLLGEVGGTNVWLARRFGAASITVVQNDPRLLSLLERELAAESGGVLTAAGVRRVARHPRLFVEQRGEPYDLIQIVPAEQLPAGAGGLASMGEDYLLTVEAVGRCLQRLTPRGMIAVTRGIQTPPRDNLKIFGLLAEAARRSGLDPGRHLLQGRNYLAVTTLLARSPLREETVEEFRRVCARLLMDAEYHPGTRAGGGASPAPPSAPPPPINEAAGPPGSGVSYYRHGAEEIVAGRAAAFARSWAYRIDPPTDNRPYFHNFFRWRSLGRLIRAHGPHWFQRLELGYLVLVFTGAQAGLLAFLLILLPLWIAGGGRRSRPPPRPAGARPARTNRLPTLLYFASIGLGFMFLEMAFLQRFTRLLGDPLSSAAAVLASLLVFAGAGSLLLGRLAGRADPLVRIRWAAALLAPAALLAWLGVEPLGALAPGWGSAARFAAVAALLCPVSLLMGVFFPSGLELLHREDVAEPGAVPLVPWAWGVNGFASVCAAPLAVLLAMDIGLGGVAVLAAGLYTCAGLATFLWRKGHPGG